MNDIIRYTETEQIYANQFGGTLIEGSRQWEIDADILTPDGKTVSIKDQLRSSAKSGNIAIGVETSDANGRVKPDWFQYIATTGFAILCTHPKTKKAIWIRCRPSKLKQWVEDNKASLRRFNLRPSTVAHNRSQGRTFNDGWGWLVPIQRLLDDSFSFTELNQDYTTK